jgi:hypothetical protein
VYFIIAKSIWRGVQGVLAANYLKDVINSLQAHDWHTARRYMIYTGIIVLINVLLSYPTRIANNKQFRKIQSVLYQRYLARFIVSDNNRTDML